MLYSMRRTRGTHDAALLQSGSLPYDIRCTQGAASSGLHLVEFLHDGYMVLSDAQLQRIGQMMRMSGLTNAQLKEDFKGESVRWLTLQLFQEMEDSTPEVEPCAWNMFLRRRCNGLCIHNIFLGIGTMC